MNLYFRLAWILLRALAAPSVAPGETIELRLRVLPNDLDLNGHVNNGRYLTLVDLGLATLFVRSGFLRLCLARRWRPMGGGSIAYFRRGLTLFQAYTLRFTLVGWDEFWNYCAFEFVREGALHAHGFVKGAVSRPGGLVPNSEIYPALGITQPSPPLPDALRAWIAADTLLGERARRPA
ncbi:MAG: thioesterase family protein [Betaproteobacteria bacterium]|nr:thioesterase family protein [Betaproteobacteria bacterium]